MDRMMSFNEAKGAQLKAFRVEYQVKAKDVSELIGKSPAYVSKLEKGDIRQIEVSELKKITNYIVGNENGYDLFLEKYIRSVDDEALQNDLTLMNFDWTIRRIPVAQKLIQSIREMMSFLEVTPEFLVAYINQNEEIPINYINLFKSDEKLEKNKWVSFHSEEKIDPEIYIYLQYSLDRVKRLLEGDINKCEFLFVYAVVYHLFKIKIKRSVKLFDIKAQAEAKTCTKQFLMENRFYSLSLKVEAMDTDSTVGSSESILSEFDRQNAEYVLNLISCFKSLSDNDVKYTNEKLGQMVKNFDEVEASFVLAYMAISLNDLKSMPSNLKREFLNEIKTTVNRYANLQDSYSGIEKY